MLPNKSVHLFHIFSSTNVKSRLMFTEGYQNLYYNLHNCSQTKKTFNKSSHDHILTNRV